jgi:hypothetical protein
MAYATEIGEKLLARRNAFVELTSKEKPSGEDAEQAVKMADELKTIEAEYKRAQGIDQANADAKEALEREREEREINGKAVSGAPLPAPWQKGANLDAERVGAGVLSRKSLSQLVAESPQYRALSKGGVMRQGEIFLENALFMIKAAGDPITASQFGFRYDDAAIPAHFANAQPTVADLIRVVPVRASSVRYFRTTPATGGPDMVAEGGLKPEVQLRWLPIDAPLEVCAEWTAVTLQALSDVPQMRAIIDADLRLLLLNKIYNQLLNGTGTPPQLQGILTISGLPTQAFVTDALTTIATAITTIQTSGAGMPTGIIMHPTNWQAIRLLNASGVYYFGMPTEVGIQRLWGIPGVLSPHMTAGFALVGDFEFATIYESWGVRFIVGWKNDDLIRNMETIVCEARLAVGVRRLGAFVNADIVTP